MKIKYKYFIKIYYKIIIAVFVVVLFFTVCIYYVTKKIEPTVLAFCDAKAKSMALKVTNDVVNEHVKEIKYKEIVNLVSNEDGKLVSVKTDVLTMNELSSEISLEIQKQLNNLDNGQILISIGSMTGNKLLYDVGPKFHVNVYPVGNVSVNFISEFSDAGINQTKHKIFLEVKTKVRIVAPFISKFQEYIYNVNIAETVIIGDVPSTYYNFTGSSGIDEKDSLNMIK